MGKEGISSYGFVKKVSICRVICNECGHVYSKEYTGNSKTIDFIKDARKNGWKISAKHQCCGDCLRHKSDEVKKMAHDISEYNSAETLGKRTIRYKVKKYCDERGCTINVPENIVTLINEVDMTKHEKEVFIGRELDKVSLETMGDRLGVSRQRAQAIEASLVKKIVKYLGKKENTQKSIERKEWEEIKVEDVEFPQIVIKTFEKGCESGDFEHISTIKDVINNRSKFKNIIGIGKTREALIYNKMVELGATNQTFNEWRA